jgi:hypothetical protein
MVARLNMLKLLERVCSGLGFICVWIDSVFQKNIIDPSYCLPISLSGGGTGHIVAPCVREEV